MDQLQRRGRLVVDMMGSRFVTMGLYMIDARSDVMTWASAGHDPAFVYDTAGDSFAHVDGGGVPLGIETETVYEQYRFCPVKAGQIIILGTDGIWEAANPDGDFFGKERLRECIRQNARESALDITAAMNSGG
jgi:sigma-B regulation protein RsbU (phosphoserine phosphatase)